MTLPFLQLRKRIEASLSGDALAIQPNFLPHAMKIIMRVVKIEMYAKTFVQSYCLSLFFYVS